jgi:CRP-like cAMP-binding protein
MSIPNLLSYIDEVVLTPAKATIFREGERGDYMYLIIAGEVEVWRDGKQLATRSTGEIIGEVAFFDGGGRSALVIARTDCRLARITRQQFELLVANVPDFVPLILARLDQ